MLKNCASKNKTIIIKKADIENSNTTSSKNIFYIIDGKEVSANFIKTITPNNIESLTVIKDKKKVAKYTAKKVDGVIIIKMKKN